MKKILSILSAALPSAALAFSGGTTEGAINAGGAISYATTTVAGSQLTLDAHGGYYVVDSVLVGGDLMVTDDEAVTTYEASAICRYHFLDPWLLSDQPGLSWLSPYMAVRLGFASGDNGAESESGAVAALRLGNDFFFTENLALDLFVDASASTGDVYPDEADLASSQVRFHIGLDWFF